MRRIQATALALVAAVVTVTRWRAARQVRSLGDRPVEFPWHDVRRHALHLGWPRSGEPPPRPAAARRRRSTWAAHAAAFCLASTGANPVRPHMIAINPSQTHAIISFVAIRPRAVHGCGDARSRSPASGRPPAPAALVRRTCPRRPPTRPTSRSPTRTANCSSASSPTTPPTRSSTTLPPTSEPRHLHDAERPALPGAGASARQCADLPDHRIDQPVHLRHAARRRTVRRR